MSSGGVDVTQLLESWTDRDQESQQQLLEAIYSDLRRIARGALRRERPNHTFQTTDLVNEAYLRLVDQSRVQYQNRGHFFAIAAQAMRRILVDHARKHQAEKRIGAHQKVPLELAPEILADPDFDVLGLDTALRELAKLDSRQAKIVELRLFAGLTGDETAEALDLSRRTVVRELTTAKLWLRRALAD